MNTYTIIFMDKKRKPETVKADDVFPDKEFLFFRKVGDFKSDILAAYNKSIVSSVLMKSK